MDLHLSLRRSLHITGLVICCAFVSVGCDDGSSGTSDEFDSLDTNGDGVVSPEEFGGTAEDFAALDADGDGNLSPEEFAKKEVMNPDAGSAIVPLDETPEWFQCTPEQPPPAAGCVVQSSGENLLIEGTVLGPKDVYLDGGVLISATGNILCAGCDCATKNPGSTPTQMRCADAIISPALVNTHDHMGWMHNSPANWGTERYEHRHDWRKGLRGHTKISASGGASHDEKAWGELRQVLGGATTLAGSGSTSGFMRNVDKDDQEGLGQSSVELDTFPLGDTKGTFRTNDCSYPDSPAGWVLSTAAYVPHVAEGIDAEAHNELLCLTSADRGGMDVAGPNTAFIHVIAATPGDAAALADGSTSVVWSPRSNISLYGNTAPVTMLDTMGVRIALGTDWAPSGSINVLRELQCADYLNRVHYDNYFTSQEIWRMATVNAAGALAIDDVVGSLAEGMIADVAVFRGQGGDDPWSELINAGIGDVLLVLRGGKPLYGDTAALEAINASPFRAWAGGATEICDAIPGGVCGEDRSVCVLSEIGMSFDELAQINSGSYDLFFCDTPPGEPTCVPSRPGEYQGGVGPGDADGDGLADQADNCPTVFNPVRPMDDGVQGDVDGDGDGDACDICPMDANTELCSKPNPDDRDADGVLNASDNCPDKGNPDQADGDNDNKGDLCDPCPDVANPGSQGCPASIYAIKKGEVELGAQVAVTAVVSAVAGASFFLQVPKSEQDPVQGAQYSGIFVYMGSGEGSTLPEPIEGATLRLTGKVDDFYGQKQLNNVTEMEVVSAAGSAPDAVIIDTLADVSTGGSLADKYEGVLVQVTGVVTGHNPPAGAGDKAPTNEFLLDGLRVNDLMHLSEPMPEVGEALVITGVLRFANQDSKIEPRRAEDIQLDPNAEPRLSSLSHDLVYIDAGTSVAHPELILALNITAKENVAVQLNSAIPSVLSVPSSVSVTPGEQTVAVPMTGITAASQPVEITATLDDVSRKTWVRVLDPDRAPLLSPIEPNPLNLYMGTSADIFVALEVPAPEAGAMVTVDVDGTGFTVSPATQQIGAWELGATFTITANAGTGGGDVTFKTPASQATLGVELSDKPLIGLAISEVMHNPGGSDDKLEWVEIYNGTVNSVDLAGYSLGYSDGNSIDKGYAAHTYSLTGTLLPGECLVVGGPGSSSANANPTYDHAADFDPDIQNSNKGCALGLFSVTADKVKSGTIPTDAVIYGDDNARGFMDSEGNIPVAAHVKNAPSENSLERTLDGWVLQSSPNPGDCAF